MYVCHRPGRRSITVYVTGQAADTTASCGAFAAGGQQKVEALRPAGRPFIMYHVIMYSDRKLTQQTSFRLF